MTTVKVGENESLESALKRFKRKCQKDGIIGDIRKKEAYDKPSVAKKKKRLKKSTSNRGFFVFETIKFCIVKFANLNIKFTQIKKHVI